MPRRHEPEVAASLEDDLARRQVVLIGLLDKVPAQAEDAIQHALQQGAKTIDRSATIRTPAMPLGPEPAARVEAVRVRAVRARWRQSGSGPGQ